VQVLKVVYDVDVQCLCRDVSVSDGVPSAITKGLGGNLEAGRGLVPLVFVTVDPGHDILTIEAS
jgi:hypothetical protein